VRAAFRHTRYWTCLIADWVPLTWRGALALGLLVWLFFNNWDQPNYDRILLGLSIAGLVATALALGLVLLTSLCLWALPSKEENPLTLEAGVPWKTGYVIPLMGWLPLVKVSWSWQRPDGVKVSIHSRWGRLEEEIIAEERALRQTIVRRLEISDVFGLTRFAVLHRTKQQIKVIPGKGQLGPQQLLQQHDHGDQQGHPQGKAQGDLIEMRPYTPGDPLKLVLWRIYARTGRMLVRTPERAVSPSERTLAYLVARKGDEATAGVARSLLENGSLSTDWLFRAEGEETAVRGAPEAVDQVIRSANARPRGGEGLEIFLELGESEGVRACILVVPAQPGKWLAQVEEQPAALDAAEPAVAQDGAERHRPAPSGGQPVLDRELC
jgi:hypothetical protein